MAFQRLPRRVTKTIVPPIKCQGIKTKLVDFVLSNITWDGSGRWVEPFVGSGVVVFNVKPKRALLNDTNPHIIRLYQRLHSGELTAEQVKLYLQQEGQKLAEVGESYYYKVRERFNESSDSLDFLFLNRSCFNGVMRFNKKGAFNVPFCRKTDRFRQAYVTKITNQVDKVSQILQGRDWEFRCGDWRGALTELDPGDFVYLDPPYIGRHTDYYSQWSEAEAVALAQRARELPCGMALSMWKSNKYRDNEHLSQHWSWTVEQTFSHFYHVGSKESLRNAVEEALMIAPGYAALAEETLGSDTVQLSLLT